MLANSLLGWCPMSDSNRPPTDYKSVALPDELMGQIFTTLEFYPTSQSSRQALAFWAHR